MKLKLFVLTLLVLIAPALCAQVTPTWFRVTISDGYFAIPSSATVVTLRYGTATGTTNTGIDCSKGAGCWNVITPTLPLSNVWVNCCFLGQPDPAPGLVKEIDVLETTTAQTVMVNNAPVAIPVVLPPSYPPFTFVVNDVLNVYVTNIPPATPTSPLQAMMTIKNGNIAIAQFVCTYGTTLTNTDTPPSLAALFSCQVQPVPASLVAR